MAMALPANSTFLPVLDDLLSPDLRPILQTPTADFVSIPAATGSGRLFGITASGSGTNGVIPIGIQQPRSLSSKRINMNERRIPEEDIQEASRRIQTWWRKHRRYSTGVDIGAERAKHSIRHRRTEEHIHYLETEVNRLKSVLSAERKLRSLQVDAIRSLWSQVQKISSSTAAGDTSIMTQSMPNGFSSSPRKYFGGQGDGTMSMSYTAGAPIVEMTNETTPDTCGSTCTKEIQLLRESMSEEISQLRDMITTLKIQDSEMKQSIEIDTESGGSTSLSQPQRPFSLNIVGMTTSVTNQGDIETPEIKEYAGELAKRLIETAVEDEEEASGSKVCKNCVAKEMYSK